VKWRNATLIKLRYCCSSEVRELVNGSGAQVEDLDSTHESHTTIVNDDEITSDLEVSAGALTSGDGNDGSHAWNVVACRR